MFGREGAGKMLHILRAATASLIPKQSLVPEAWTLSGSADTQNHNHHLIKEILSESSKAGKSETDSL